jgi:hypothetical protein
VTWVNLDDQMPEHPKIVKLSDGAFRLHISGIAYCNRYLTDGVIHADVVSRLMPRFRKTYLDELLASTNGTQPPLWLPRVESYEIRDYLQWNKSREQIKERSKARSEGGRKGADRRWHDP